MVIRLLYVLFFQLADKLLTKETLQYSEVEEVLGPSPFGKKHIVDPVSFFDEELRLSEKQRNSAKSQSQKTEKKASSEDSTT